MGVWQNRISLGVRPEIVALTDIKGVKVRASS